MLDLDDVAEVVASAIKDATAPLIARIADLEARAPQPGEKGETGEPGVVDMDAVKALVEGAVAKIQIPEPPPGPQGDPGERGEKGDTGDAGADGKDGVGLAGMMIDRSGEGIATLSDGTLVRLGQLVGRDGKDGSDGQPGEKGEPGTAGKDGRDGLDVTDIQVRQDGETVEFEFAVGEARSIYEVIMPKARDGKDGRDGADAYPGEAKGLYDPKVKYRALDCVSLNGSEWRAKVDGPGELPGPDWMLGAKRGETGRRGEKGDAGRDGVMPVAAYLRGSELITTLSDGAEITADLSPLREQDDNG